MTLQTSRHFRQLDSRTGLLPSGLASPFCFYTSPPDRAKVATAALRPVGDPESGRASAIVTPRRGATRPLIGSYRHTLHSLRRLGPPGLCSLRCPTFSKSEPRPMRSMRSRAGAARRSSAVRASFCTRPCAIRRSRTLQCGCGLPRLATDWGHRTMIAAPVQCDADGYQWSAAQPVCEREGHP
jgi:hypothetical protein